MRAVAGSVLISIVIVAASIHPGVAEEYPARGTTILVPFAPGGGTDLIARTLAQKLEQRLGKSFVVENRPGAGTTIAAAATAKAEPDGYTLMQATSGTMAMNPTIFKTLPYDPEKDLVPVSLIAGVPFILVVHPSLGVKSIPDLVKVAKERKLSYGSGGVGAFHHLNAELFSSMLGIKMTHVPYKGENPAIADTIGGQIPIMFGNLPVALPHVQSGKLRALATTTAQRSPLAPEIPTVAEGGMKDFEMATWYGMLAPAGTPPELVAKIQRDAARVLRDRDTSERLTKMGVDLVLNTPEAFRAYLQSEIARYTSIIKANGLKAE